MGFFSKAPVTIGVTNEELISVLILSGLIDPQNIVSQASSLEEKASTATVRSKALEHDTIESYNRAIAAAEDIRDAGLEKAKSLAKEGSNLKTAANYIRSILAKMPKVQKSN